MVLPRFRVRLDEPSLFQALNISVFLAFSKGSDSLSGKECGGIEFKFIREAARIFHSRRWSLQLSPATFLQSCHSFNTKATIEESNLCESLEWSESV